MKLMLTTSAVLLLALYLVSRPRRYVTGCQCSTCRRHRPGWPWT